jgi:DNA-binding response OmpR family regulator
LPFKLRAASTARRAGSGERRSDFGREPSDVRAAVVHAKPRLEPSAKRFDVRAPARGRAGDAPAPKAYQVLTYLALNSGRLVPKEEILKAVWRMWW